MRAEVEKITPSKALKWLEQNTHNRPKRRRRVKHYADLMNDGEWLMNGDPIRFDRHGRLLDGQHRLESIVESGKAYETVVIYDLEPDAFSTIDQGARRTMADHLAVMNIKNHSRIAPALPVIWHYEQGTLEFADDSDRRPPHKVLCDFAEKTEGLQHALHVSRQLGLYKLMSDSMSIALTWILSRVNKKKAEEFLTLLCSDHDLEARHQQVRHLRDWLLNKKFSPDRVRRMTVCYEACMSWNAWIKDRTIREARDDLNGGFPYPNAK